MKRNLVVGLALVTIATIPLRAMIGATEQAQSKVSGPNGQIAFSRGDGQIFITDPDGRNEHELLLPHPAVGPVWSPDGSTILVTVFSPQGIRPATVDPNGSGFTLLAVREAPTDMFLSCRAWSPDGIRLLCKGQNEADSSVDGIYTIRAFDGGDFQRLTVNPFPPTGEFGGGDIPGDYSPDGTRFVFMRAKPGADPNARLQKGALFVENTDGSSLHQITPYGLANSHDNGVASWSSDGTEILFASEHGMLFVVQATGKGLRRIPLDTSGGRSFAFAPGWSPDGKSIVFSMFLRTIGREDIYTARSDGNQVARVTDSPDFEDSADWGADPQVT